jgi:hypothetical protein
MSIVGRIVRATGVYDLLHNRFHSLFFEKTLLPFATKASLNLVEATFLAELTREAHSERPIIEIGALFGFSTKIILLNKSPAQRLIAVDMFKWNPANLTPNEHFAITDLSLRAFAGGETYEIVRANKNDFYRTYNGPPPSLVFLDADHSYEETRKDIDWAIAVRAGIICGHDYSPICPGVVQAVDEAGGASRICGSLWRLKQ